MDWDNTSVPFNDVHISRGILCVLYGPNVLYIIIAVSTYRSKSKVYLCLYKHYDIKLVQQNHLKQIRVSFIDIQTSFHRNSMQYTIGEPMPFTLRCCSPNFYTSLFQMCLPISYFVAFSPHRAVLAVYSLSPKAQHNEIRFFPFTKVEAQAFLLYFPPFTFALCPSICQKGE